MLSVLVKNNGFWVLTFMGFFCIWCFLGVSYNKKKRYYSNINL